MTTQYKIVSAITNGVELTIITKCCEQIGIRKDEYGNGIPIIRSRKVTVVIQIKDLLATGKVGYLRTQIEAAYNALPDETLVKSLIGKTWSG